MACTVNLIHKTFVTIPQSITYYFYPSLCNPDTMRPFTVSATLVLALMGQKAGAFVAPSLPASPASAFVSRQSTGYVSQAAAFSVTTQSKARLPGSVLFMGWGPDPVWSSGTVVSNFDACPSRSCISLTVTVTPATLKEFAVPGQYVQVRQAGKGDSDDNKPLFLAIASPPPAEADEAAGAPSEFEFLIKKTDNNGWITDAGEGLEVEVSQVLGGGFPIKEEIEGIKYDFPTQNVLLFANGSGIAPLRSAIESGQLGTLDGGRSARLYYGVATPSDMPYAERFPAWEKMGIEVVPVISRPEEVDGGWLGRVGYVQTALEEDGVAIPRNTGALMCGVKGMCEGVKDILTRAGTFEGRVLTNF